ncbi:MAG: PAS domain S-box protein [Defluviimonas sp.]|nr:PAS domain S-box protein [Defluviimonas sp.]
MTDPELLQLGFQEAPVALMILSNRRILRVNAEFESLFGWPQPELAGQSVRLLYPSSIDYEKTGSRWVRRLAGQQRHEDERFMRCRSGATLWMRARGRTLTPDDPFRLTLWAFDPLPDRMTGTEALTLREREVAGYVVKGFTSKEIGQALGISPRTVEVHRSAIMRKLGVGKAAEMVARITGRA